MNDIVPGQDAERIRQTAKAILDFPERATEFADELYKLGFYAGRVSGIEYAQRAIREAQP